MSGKQIALAVGDSLRVVMPTGMVVELEAPTGGGSEDTVTVATPAGLAAAVKAVAAGDLALVRADPVCDLGKVTLPLGTEAEAYAFHQCFGNDHQPDWFNVCLPSGNEVDVKVLPGREAFVAVRGSGFPGQEGVGELVCYREETTPEGVKIEPGRWGGFTMGG